ncbi:MAG: sulfurtransferase-like selenium metabolism protein YedF [Deltaproteobacteria bacterium HGW-Deltaproteobacteria-12]|jgi:selenium metabolism protein YedF|nr:MAG: sulfurtransferase-like selenium metabolism protein YedF [Deltaproteobacteria bacterium HGW-Deltaproteobacteria-12]
MTDVIIVDVRGLSCPQPVVLTKKALESGSKVKVMVDDETALENIKRLGAKLAFEVKAEKKDNGTFEIDLTRKAGVVPAKEEGIPSPSVLSGPFVIVLAENKMGRGNDELGYVLVRAFLHTIAEQSQKPDVMIFYNTGVELTVQGSEVLDDLKALEMAGVEILVCGTCLNYFEVKDKLDVGVVSNMYDIAATMSRAGRLIYP